MIISNIKQDGDNFRILSKPMLGITGFSAFTENLTGSTGTWQSRTYRYSVDGINFSEWSTVSTITGDVYSVTDFVVIELLYKRSLGSDRGITSLELTEITGTLTWQDVYFAQSNYSQYFEQNDSEMLGWALNVLNKVYRTDGGVIPDYIGRRDDEEIDSGFIEFWRAISYFFALDVKLARTVSQFYSNELLSRLYLEGRGLFTSKSDDITTLQYLESTLNHQMFNRGTSHIVDSVVNSGDTVDGELVRLLSNSEHDELLFCFHKKEHFGWNLGNSSPLYRGLNANPNANKITATGQRVRIDSSLDYEFTFKIQVGLTDQVTVAFDCEDRYGNTVAPRQRHDNTYSNVVFNNILLQRDDKEITITIFIYNHSSANDPLDTTNIKQGHNLIFSEDIAYVMPVVYVAGFPVTLSDGVYFGIAATEYSHGILQSCNWISAYLRNLSTYTFDQIKQHIRRFLIPYSATVGFTEINSIYLDPDNPLNSYVDEDYWTPSDYAIPQI